MIGKFQFIPWGGASDGPDMGRLVGGMKLKVGLAWNSKGSSTGLCEKNLGTGLAVTTKLLSTIWMFAQFLGVSH